MGVGVHFHRAKPPGKPRIDTSKVKDTQMVKRHEKSLEDALEVKPPEANAKTALGSFNGHHPQHCIHRLWKTRKNRRLF